jgi:hypothetical protein
VVVVFLGDVVKLGHHPQSSSLPPNKKTHWKPGCKKYAHTHRVIDNSHLRRRSVCYHLCLCTGEGICRKEALLKFCFLFVVPLHTLICRKGFTALLQKNVASFVAEIWYEKFKAFFWLLSHAKMMRRSSWCLGTTGFFLPLVAIDATDLEKRQQRCEFGAAAALGFRV